MGNLRGDGLFRCYFSGLTCPAVNKPGSLSFLHLLSCIAWQLQIQLLDSSKTTRKNSVTFHSSVPSPIITTQCLDARHLIALQKVQILCGLVEVCLQTSNAFWKRKASAEFIQNGVAFYCKCYFSLISTLFSLLYIFGSHFRHIYLFIVLFL